MKFQVPQSRTSRGFSLAEMLTVISVIGIMAAIAIPTIQDINGAGNTVKNQANARHVEGVSSALGALGVAHVIPESLGGAEATVRLLREGVIVPDGAFEGQLFVVKAISDNDVSNASSYLEILYNYTELHLSFHDISQDQDSSPSSLLSTQN